MKAESRSSNPREEQEIEQCACLQGEDLVRFVLITAAYTATFAMTIELICTPVCPEEVTLRDRDPWVSPRAKAGTC